MKIDETTTISVQGADLVSFDLAVKPFKGMSKEKFSKKYKGKIIDLDFVFEKLKDLNKK